MIRARKNPHPDAHHLPVALHSYYLHMEHLIDHYERELRRLYDVRHLLVQRALRAKYKKQKEFINERLREDRHTAEGADRSPPDSQFPDDADHVRHDGDHEPDGGGAGYRSAVRV